MRRTEQNDHNHQSPNATPVLVGMVTDTVSIGDHIRSYNWMCTTRYSCDPNSRSIYLHPRRAMHNVTIGPSCMVAASGRLPDPAKR